MSKKILCILIAFILFLTCFSGCADDEEIFLSCPVSEMPQHFDPQIADTQGERIVSVNTFDGLFKLDETGQPQKCAVMDYKVSADGLVYTFYLREDMNYFVSKSTQSFLEDLEATIDTKVTAQDFAFGITRAILPETDSPGYDLLSAIKNAESVHNGTVSSTELGIKVLNDYTLEITLERKSDEFLFALSQPVSFPCDEKFFNLTAGRYGLERKYTLSNGPFYLSDIAEDESVRFSQTPEYKGDFSAIATSVRLYVNSDQNDIVKKINGKNYSVAFLTSQDVIQELNKKNVKTDFENTTVSLIFNTSNEIMQNNALRIGLVKSIDFKSVGITQAKSLVPSVFNFRTDKSIVLSTDVNAAREKVKSALKELEKDKLTIDILCTSENENIAKNIVNCWQKNIGVELNGTVTVVDEKDFISNVNKGSYVTAIYPLTTETSRTVDFLAMFKSGNSNNVSRYASEEYDRVYDEFRLSPTKEGAVYCQSYLLNNAVVMPISNVSSAFVAAKDVSGVYFAVDSSNIYFHKGKK